MPFGGNSELTDTLVNAHHCIFLRQRQFGSYLLKGKALTIKAEFFDILGQQSNISRWVSEFSRSDTRTNDIYQYGLFSLIYRFSIIGGKNTMGTSDERKEQRW